MYEVYSCSSYIIYNPPRRRQACPFVTVQIEEYEVMLLGLGFFRVYSDLDYSIPNPLFMDNLIGLSWWLMYEFAVVADWT